MVLGEELVVVLGEDSSTVQARSLCVRGCGRERDGAHGSTGVRAGRTQQDAHVRSARAHRRAQAPGISLCRVQYIQASQTDVYRRITSVAHSTCKPVGQPASSKVEGSEGAQRFPRHHQAWPACE